MLLNECLLLVTTVLRSRMIHTPTSTYNLLNELREESEKSQRKIWAFQCLWLEKDLNVIKI